MLHLISMTLSCQLYYCLYCLSLLCAMDEKHLSFLIMAMIHQMLYENSMQTNKQTNHLHSTFSRMSTEPE